MFLTLRKGDGHTHLRLRPAAVHSSRFAVVLVYSPKGLHQKADNKAGIAARRRGVAILVKVLAEDTPW